MTTLQQLSDVPYEIERLADDLTDGNAAFGWRGDPRLELHIGVLAADRNTNVNGKFVSKGQVLARNIQVWRHCEDGTMQHVITRRIELAHEILPELVQMDPRTPGFRSSADVVIDHNAKVDAEKEYAIGQAQGEMVEHLWKLTADRQNGKTTFRGMPGSNPDKQM